MRSKPHAVWILFVLLGAHAFTLEAGSQVASWMPHYGKIQLAGNLGLFAVGAGYEWGRERVQSDLLYGYVPKQLSGKGIHTLAQKNTISILPWRSDGVWNFVPLTLGFSANVVLGRKYFLIIPDKFRDYYAPSALRFGFNAGGRAGRRFVNTTRISELEFFAEVSSLDFYLRAFGTSQYVSMKDVLSLALGFALHI